VQRARLPNWPALQKYQGRSAAYLIPTWTAHAKTSGFSAIWFSLSIGDAPDLVQSHLREEREGSRKYPCNDGQGWLWLGQCPTCEAVCWSYADRT